MTDDLMRAMTRLAERGTPVGIDEMVDRIEAEFASATETSARRGRARPQAPSWRRVAAVLVVAVAVALAVVLVWLPVSGDGGGSERVSTTVLTPEHLSVGPRAVLAAPGQGPALLVRTAGALWAAGGAPDRDGDTLYELDPASGAVRARVTVPGRVVAIASGFRSLWLAVAGPTGSTSTGHVLRVDPRTARTVASIPVGTPTQLAVGAGAVWATDARAGLLSKIDPTGNQVLSSAPIGGATAVAVAGSQVWVTSPVNRQLVVVNPTSLVSSSVYQLEPDALSIVTSGDNLWLTASADDHVTLFSGATPGRVGSVAFHGRVLATTPAPGGGLWVAMARKGQTVVGLTQPGHAGFVSSHALGIRSASAMVLVHNGLWMLDPASSTLSLLEAK